METMKDATPKDAVAALLDSLGFEGMANECRLGKHPVERFVPLVIRQTQKRFPKEYPAIRQGLVKLGLLYF